jgi:hypothetical protein
MRQKIWISKAKWQFGPIGPLRFCYGVFLVGWTKANKPTLNNLAMENRSNWLEVLLFFYFFFGLIILLRIYNRENFTYHT